jgi:hypothetical protein
MNHIEQLKNISYKSSVSRNQDTNMTAKEKARQLVDSFYLACPIQDIPSKDLLEIARTCAAITADELIETTRSKFWYDVKEQISKV